MRIISKFHDYYDTAMGMGIDPNLIYRRETRAIEVPRWTYDKKIIEIMDIRPTWASFKPHLCALGFCGKCYSVWIDGEFSLTEESLSKHVSPVPMMTIEEVGKYFLEMAIERYRIKAPRDLEREQNSVRTLTKNFEAAQGLTISEDLFRQFECPTFIAFQDPEIQWGEERKLRVIANPRLATLGFNRVFDSYTAFQEISMFLGSQLAPEDRAPRTTGDDKTIAASKGFDEQSFRTQAPGQKKLNRQANKKRKHSDGP